MSDPTTYQQAGKEETPMLYPPLKGKGNTKQMRKQKKTRHGTRTKSKKQY
jgi:hypothetical protein